MDMAKVLGSVVATVKDPLLQGVKLSVIQPVDDAGVAVGAPLVASDYHSRYGTGELVFFVRSGDAMETGAPGTLLPVDAAVVGIVDQVKVLH